VEFGCSASANDDVQAQSQVSKNVYVNCGPKRGFCFAFMEMRLTHENAIKKCADLKFYVCQV